MSLLVDAAPRGDDAGGPPVRRLAQARWGLIPAWADDPSVGARAFNARIETAAEKPTFQGAVVSRRAVIPATGYYEWATGADGIKKPYFISLPDDEVMLFAGLYEWWRDPTAAEGSPGRWILSATILTRDAVGPLADIHERMPVLIDAEIMEDWLDPYAEGDADLLEGISGEAEQHAWRVVVTEVPGGRVGGPVAVAAPAT